MDAAVGAGKALIIYTKAEGAKDAVVQAEETWVIRTRQWSFVV